MKIGKIISVYRRDLPKAYNRVSKCDTCDTTFDIEYSHPYTCAGGMCIEAGKDCPLCLIKAKEPTKKLTQEQIDEKKEEIKRKLNKEK